MTRSAGPVMRASLAGAYAMSALGIVEILFSDLLYWALRRDSFAPLDPLFAVALFIAYPVSGALVAAVVSGLARRFRRSPPPRELGTTIVLAFHAAFLTPRFSTGVLLLIGTVNVSLLALTLAAMVSGRPRERVALLTSPWTCAFLLVAPGWVLSDVVVDGGRLVRAASFVLVAALVVALAGLLFGMSVPRRVAAAVTALLSIAVLVTACFADTAPPRQIDFRAAPLRLRSPNVLLVVLDTVRADHLSLYGYARDTSPNLRRFAESATLYRHAIAPSNMTLATHASLFTGLVGSEHRAHYDAGRPAGRPLGTTIPTLAEIFVKRGYDVSAVAGNYGFLQKGFGLDRGFRWLDARPRRSSLGVVPEHSLRWAFRQMICRAFPESWPVTDTRGRDADEITKLAIRRIDRARDMGRPWFLFVNYFDAHERVLVPPPFAGRFSSSPVRATGTLFDAFFREMNRSGHVDLPARDREDLVSRYDEALAYTDSALERLLRHAIEQAPDDDTLIVVTSDHGEAWGEHGAIGHGSSAYQEQIRVPLVVKKPRQTRKETVDATVGLTDLFRLLRGEISDLPTNGTVVSESFPLVPAPAKATLRTGRALFLGPHKLIRSSRDGTCELYDTATDPGELHDLAGRPDLSDTLSRMNTTLDQWIAAHPPVESPEMPESREDRARLRALGYLR
jgi:hypothetical protein